MFNLRDIFDKRAATLTDHDPWRYGKRLSLKADLAELSWVENHIKGRTLLDVGCGTGRHCLELAEKYPDMQFDCFDFAANNIKVLNNKIKERNLQNIHTKVCGTDNMVDAYKGRTFDNILSIGLIQYLEDEELGAHFKDCHSLLNTEGVAMIKHPTAYTKTFVFDGYSELLQSRYISKYRDFQDVIRLVHPYFEMLKIERTFTLDNLTKEELGTIETHDNTKQLWFLLRRREHVMS